MDLSHLACHISKEVLHHIQREVNYADIDKHKDTNNLWALLKISAVTKGTYNLQKSQK